MVREALKKKLEYGIEFKLEEILSMGLEKENWYYLNHPVYQYEGRFHVFDKMPSGNMIYLMEYKDERRKNDEQPTNKLLA